MEKVPSELWIDILQRLPLKNVYRMQQTCKYLSNISLAVSDDMLRFIVPEQYDNKLRLFKKHVRLGKLCDSCLKKKSGSASMEVEHAFGFKWCFDCILAKLIAHCNVWKQLMDMGFKVPERNIILQKSTMRKISLFGYTGRYYVCTDVIKYATELHQSNDGGRRRKIRLFRLNGKECT